MQVSSDAIEALNTLLHRSKDAQRGYTETSEGVANPSFKSWMTEYSMQRRQFASELEQEIRNLGGEPDDRDTSLLGDLHHFWINLKGLFTDDDNPANMVEECKRGEEKAIKDYQDVLDKQELPASTRVLLHGQQEKIRTALQTLAGMSNAYSDSTVTTNV